MLNEGLVNIVFSADNLCALQFRAKCVQGEPNLP